MSYKVIDGRIVSTSKKQKLGGAALGFQVDDKLRKIYMVRMRVDKFGRCHEENRTTFHQPGWLDMTESGWMQLRDSLLAEMDNTARQQPGLNDLGKYSQNVKINVY